MGAYQRASAGKCEQEKVGQNVARDSYLMTAPLRILHLEDDPVDVEFVKATLAEESIACELSRIETRDDFIAAIDEGKFDIIFADYSLPYFDGLAALYIAKEKCPDIPFIFITGKMGEELAIETLKSGATDYVLKNKLSMLVPAVLRALREAMDRAERKKAEEDLQRSREELRNLSSHLQAVREKERAYIAREIHDELGQVLTALNMDVSWLRNKFKGEEMIASKAESMTDLVNSAIKTIKKISSELRPALLDDLGLGAAIEWQAEEFQKRTGIACDVVIPENIILDKDLSTAIFRIFQEALTNVMRHAKATKVSAHFEKNNGRIVLNIEDNGKGITEKQKFNPRSFGLIGMRERVISLGGQICITGIRSKGTKITVSIPLDVLSK